MSVNAISRFFDYNSSVKNCINHYDSFTSDDNSGIPWSCESEKLGYLKTLAKSETSNRVVDWALFKCSAASTGLQKLDNIKKLLQLIYKQSMFKDFGSGRSLVESVAALHISSTVIQGISNSVIGQAKSQLTKFGSSTQIFFRKFGSVDSIRGCCLPNIPEYNEDEKRGFKLSPWISRLKLLNS